MSSMNTESCGHHTNEMIRCSACGQMLRVPQQQDELRLRCPKCGSVFTYRAPSTVPSPPPLTSASSNSRQPTSTADVDRLEKRFHTHFAGASGPVLHRNAIAVAMMELEDPWLSQVMADFSAEEQRVFLMAYQCFVLWAVAHALWDRLKPDELQDLADSIRDAFATLDYHSPAIFHKIWPHTQELMAMELQKDSGYPMVSIVQAAILAGYPLPHKMLGYRLDVHPIVVMRRARQTLVPDAKPDA
jgi:phage FluMu protein Com